MSSTYIPAALRRLVEERANYRCEYCLLPNKVSFFPHEIDHIIAEKHGGKTDEDNLAFTCWRCNRHKGTDLGSFDLHTREFSFLFHPRQQKWSDHFAFEEAVIVGLTNEGRTTAKLLQFNSDERLAERKRLSR
ncbi:MAG: HNH endonuclease signature motif containing protein [Calothrix sp. MO_167.B42]|nr:HNH endonuclease signature motif containing protein [Calothrix sp. MO_167.B42]